MSIGCRETTSTRSMRASSRHSSNTPLPTMPVAPKMTTFMTRQVPLEFPRTRVLRIPLLVEQQMVRADQSQPTVGQPLCGGHEQASPRRLSRTSGWRVVCCHRLRWPYDGNDGMALGEIFVEPRDFDAREAVLLEEVPRSHGPKPLHACRHDELIPGELAETALELFERDDLGGREGVPPLLLEDLRTANVNEHHIRVLGY